MAPPNCCGRSRSDEAGPATVMPSQRPGGLVTCSNKERNANKRLAWSHTNPARVQAAQPKFGVGWGSVEDEVEETMGDHRWTGLADETVAAVAAKAHRLNLPRELVDRTGRVDKLHAEWACPFACINAGKGRWGGAGSAHMATKDLRAMLRRKQGTDGGVRCVRRHMIIGLGRDLTATAPPTKEKMGYGR
jgi:hypothetical protein